jgi:hypothetical protein
LPPPPGSRHSCIGGNTGHDDCDWVSGCRCVVSE